MFKKNPEGVICICGRSAYATRNIVIGIDSGLYYVSPRISFWQCLFCTSQWIMRLEGGKIYQHTITEMDQLVKWDRVEQDKPTPYEVAAKSASERAVAIAEAQSD